jgi:hypothetical protein
MRSSNKLAFSDIGSMVEEQILLGNGYAVHTLLAKLKKAFPLRST